MEQVLNMNLTVDSVPYVVKATAGTFNSEKQYMVSINNGEEIPFIFDPELGRYAPVGDNAIDVADGLEIAIGNKLNANSTQ